MFSEVLPNCPALIVQGVAGGLHRHPRRGGAGFSASARSRGLRVGTMLADAREFCCGRVVGDPARLMILLTVLAFNLLGDGLRDALDPKLKR